MKKFDRDPIIIWDKFYCPVCKHPTGPKSTCYEESESKSNKLMLINGNILPLFSKSCYYRENNLWTIHLNYPASMPLVHKLVKIAGVQSAIPSESYSIKLSIGRAFDEDEVKRNVNSIFKTFIKEMNAAEAEIDSNADNKEIFNIELPNGKIIKGTLDNIGSLVDIRDSILNVKKIDPK